MLSVQITRREQLEPVLLSAEADVVMLDFSQADDYTELKRMADRIHETGKLAGYCFPYIFRASCRQAMTRDREALLSCGFDRFLVRSYDSLGFCLLQLNLPAEKIQADHSLYVFSTHARAAFSDAASDDLLTTAPVELNGNELRHQNNARAELILYGRIPLMISAQCVYRNYRACKKRAKKIQKLVLIDRNNNRLPVETDCSNCFSIIRSQKPLYLLDAAEEISRMNFYGYRLIFTDEEADEVRHILKQCSVTQSEPVDSFSKYYTHGHFRRGVK